MIERLFRRALLMALVGPAMAAATSFAAEPAEEQHVIAFRLAKPKTVHFDDASKAKAHADTVKQFGCEVKVDSHGGHTDVTYTLKGWKDASFANDKLADQWETWLTNAGFDAIHGHEDAAHGEAVEYRSEKWLTQHFDTAAQASEFVLVTKALGCEIKQGQHDGHFDVQFRLASWRHLEAANHDVAHARQDWLKKLGFETKHSH